MSLPMALWPAIILPSLRRTLTSCCAAFMASLSLLMNAAFFLLSTALTSRYPRFVIGETVYSFSYIHAVQVCCQAVCLSLNVFAMCLQQDTLVCCFKAVLQITLCIRGPGVVQDRITDFTGYLLKYLPSLHAEMFFLCFLFNQNLRRIMLFQISPVFHSDRAVIQSSRMVVHI